MLTVISKQLMCARTNMCVNTCNLKCKQHTRSSSKPIYCTVLNVPTSLNVCQLYIRPIKVYVVSNDRCFHSLFRPEDIAARSNKVIWNDSSQEFTSTCPREWVPPNLIWSDENQLMKVSDSNKYWYLSKLFKFVHPGKEINPLVDKQFLRQPNWSSHLLSKTWTLQYGNACNLILR